MWSLLLVSLVLIGGTVTIVADQSATHRGPSDKLGALRQAPANPYTKLFDVRGAVATAVDQQVARPTAPKSRVVCGMTVIEVGPALDPKMGVTPPKADGTRYTIRAVEPPICK